MIEKRITEAEFNQSDNQTDYLRLLRRNVNIIFHDFIFHIPGVLGMKCHNETLFTPTSEKIRVCNATFSHLNEWLEKGIEMLRSTPDHPIGDPYRTRTEAMIRVYDEGNIYF
jgi:hypothetical protein